MQFNRLKNLFLRSSNELKLWSEIQKMFNLNLISFSSEKVYWSNNIYSFSLLSRFLFEFYILELDKYISSLSFHTNSTFTIISNVGLKNFKYSDLLLNSLPLKLEKNLEIYENVFSFNRFKINNFTNYFRSLSSEIYPYKFVRKFCWVRYINFILFGFLSSNNYGKFISEKVVSFVRSNLMFDSKELSVNFFAQNDFYFLGFNVKKKFRFRNRFESSLIKVGDTYKSRMKFRISLYRRKLLSSIVSRSNSELFLFFISATKDKKISLLSFRNKKIWIFVFQQECLKALQYGKLLFTSDTVDNLSYSLFCDVKFLQIKAFVFYRKYSFNLYIRKLHRIFKELIGATESLFYYSVLPIDLVLGKYLNLLNKKISFLYENVYFSTLNSLSNNQFYSKSNKEFHQTKFWHISFSKKFLFRKLRSWGFVHPYKNRPVSNSKFLFMDDNSILKNFSSFIEKFLIWFRCCDNFISLKFFVEIVKQSCFLTISRKHNKGKVWAYSVFTPNLLVARNFSSLNYFFPKRHFGYRLYKKYLIDKNIFSFDEKFFLTNFSTI